MHIIQRSGLIISPCIKEKMSTRITSRYGCRGTSMWVTASYLRQVASSPLIHRAYTNTCMCIHMYWSY